MCFTQGLLDTKTHLVERQCYLFSCILLKLLSFSRSVYKHIFQFQNRLAQQNLKIYEKSTISSRARSRKAVKKLEAAFERDTRATIEKETSGPNWALTFAKCEYIQLQKYQLEYLSEKLYTSTLHLKLVLKTPN